MSRASAAVLLAQLKGRGVEVFAAGDRVHFRPSASVSAELRQRIEHAEPDLVALLRGVGPTRRAETGGTGTERTERSPGATSSERAPGPWLTHSFGPLVADGNRERSVPCRCCGSCDFWALIEIGHLVCGRCHAPNYLADRIRWMRVNAEAEALDA